MELEGAQAGGQECQYDFEPRRSISSKRKFFRRHQFAPCFPLPQGLLLSGLCLTSLVSLMGVGGLPAPGVPTL